LFGIITRGLRQPLATTLHFHVVMSRACIAVVDASRARLFTYERTLEAGGISEQLTEQRDLINPRAHIDELDAEFARSIIGEIADVLRTSRAERVILCASPRMLGELRAAGTALSRDSLVDEIPRDLVKLTPPQLRDRLTSYGLLPAAPARARVRAKAPGAES
jgi:protein required for attachment to host cells